MSHITEGELHAYIDGALASIDAADAERIAGHLETCGDCEARADAARALRDRTSALLDTALGEAIEPPPFEELVERAGVDIRSSDSTPGRPPLRPQRFAWAASLVVALGAGWMANAVLRDSGGSSLQSVAEPSAGAQIDADAAFEADRQELANAAPVEAEAEEEPVRSASRNERVAAAQGQGSDARENAPAPALREDANSEGAVALRRRAEVPESSVVAADAVAPATVEVQNRARGFAERERVAQDRLEEPEAEVGDDQLAKASAPAGAPAEEPESLGLAGADLDNLAWQPAEVVEANEWIGGILTLPDVEVEEYALSVHEGRRLARVRQRLPGGETLELVQLGPEAALEELRDAPSRALDEVALGRVLAETGSRVGVYTLGWIQVNGVHVRASAPVAPDSLRTLISRIRLP